MEGQVFDIGDARIAKVWHDKRPGEIAALRAFHALVEGLGLPIATPVIESIHEIRGEVVSVERAVPGMPMSDVLSVEEQHIPAFASDAIMSILAALRDHPVHDAEDELPIVGEAPPFGAQGVAKLLAVAQRKVNRYGDQLRRSVPNFDEVYAQTIHKVRALSGASRYVVHGDLCPPNIFLGEDLTVSAVVDWGFLSHIGDPALETSIACGIYDIYGPHHGDHDRSLVLECERRFGYDGHRLLVYRALYAILTSNAYSEAGTGWTLRVVCHGAEPRGCSRRAECMMTPWLAHAGRSGSRPRRLSTTIWPRIGASCPDRGSSGSGVVDNPAVPGTLGEVGCVGSLMCGAEPGVS